jgi:hypothetical protein
VQAAVTRALALLKRKLARRVLRCRRIAVNMFREIRADEHAALLALHRFYCTVRYTLFSLSEILATLFATVLVLTFA